MNLLCTATGDVESAWLERAFRYWRSRQHLVSYMDSDDLYGYLRFHPSSSHALVDAIVCFADGPSFTLSREWSFEPRYPLAEAICLARYVRDLPPQCAMRDGKMWNAIPFIIFRDAHDYHFAALVEEECHAKIAFARHSFYTYPQMTLYMVENAVRDFETRVLKEFERFGFLVRFQHGRTQILPALKTRKSVIESEFYYSPADRRRRGQWVTYSRDREGLQRDVDEFRKLLDQETNEREMHRFFEQHPLFLMQARTGIPVSHQPTFSQPKGETPDMLILPIVGPIGGDLELLELKGTTERLLTTGRHAGFAAKVHRAIDQVRDYDRQMNDPRNREAIAKALGPSTVPERRLAVLIGRAPHDPLQRELRKRRQEEVDVEIVSYDEILTIQEEQL